MLSYSHLLTPILADLERTLRTIDEAALDRLRTAIRAAPRLFIAGRGRSGLIVRAFAMRLMHLGLTVYVVDDVTTPGIGVGDLLIIGSGSGKTASLIAYASKAKERGAEVALFTAAADSPLSRLADVVVEVRAPHKEAPGGAQPMANLFEQALYLLLDIITLQLMDDLGADSAAMMGRHANLE